jgi:hypothetical protein
MGNCVGTIDWDGDPSINRDNTIIPQLRKIMEMYNLEEADPNMVISNVNKQSFHVQIAGFSIPWNGGVEKSKVRINAFLEETKQFLQNFGLKNVKTYIHHFPM